MRLEKLPPQWRHFAVGGFIGATIGVCATLLTQNLMSPSCPLGTDQGGLADTLPKQQQDTSAPAPASQ